MKKNSVLMTVLMALASLVAAPELQAEVLVNPVTVKECPELLRDARGRLAGWRARLTRVNASKQLSRTSFEREEYIFDLAREMRESISESATPVMEFIQEEGVLFAELQAVDQHTPFRVKVRGLADDGILRGTLILPVSAHTGLKDALVWAGTDLYQLEVSVGNGPRVPLVKNSESLGEMTFHEVEIPLKKGEIVKIYYYRNGSGGPMGFAGGRIIEFLWEEE